MANSNQVPKYYRQWLKLLYWFSFFMAFPSVLILGQNISVYLFGGMLLMIMGYSKRVVVTLRKPIQWFALYFAIGAVLSVANIPDSAPYDSLDRALAVLPNYLYWSLLIIFMVTHRQLINLQIVYRGIFYGLSATVIYYLFLENSLRALPIFNRQTPNNFAFVLICYTPFAIHYLMTKAGRFIAFLFLLLLTFVLLFDGRRAGTVLVFLGGLATLYGTSLNWKNLLKITMIGIISLMLLQTRIAKTFILHASERMYQLIYKTSEIGKKDASFLIRVAMVKKGIAIYGEYPYTGIGLNNFSNYNIQFDKSFEGAEYVIYKENLQKKSAHNSYITLLAEGGMILLSGFLLIVGTCLVYLVKNYFLMPSETRPIFIGFVAMFIHLYFISAIINVFAWFLIGLACAFTCRK